MEFLFDFLKGVLGDLRPWAGEQAKLLIPAMGGIIAAVQFVRYAWRNSRRPHRREPAWLPIYSPLAAGVAYMAVLPYLAPMLGAKVPTIPPVAAAIIGIGLGMLNSLLYKLGKWAWKRRSGK